MGSKTVFWTVKCNHWWKKMGHDISSNHTNGFLFDRDCFVYFCDAKGNVGNILHIQTHSTDCGSLAIP
jgi:hypothetical protein